MLRRRVGKAARKIQFDLVLSQPATAAVTAGRVRARLRVPVMMNFLDYLSGFMETWPPYVMPKPVLARIMKFGLSLPTRYQADGVMPVSDTLADYLAGMGYTKTRLLPFYDGYDSAVLNIPDGQLRGEER